MTSPSREELREHLLHHRIAGEVATPRLSNVTNIGKMLDREPDYWFGVELTRPWTFEAALAAVAAATGIDPDPHRLDGVDRLDADLCLAGLDAAAHRLRTAAQTRQSVLVATGHPTGLLALFLPVVRALAAAGCEIRTPAVGAAVSLPAGRRRIRYLGGVAMLATGGDLLHTHAPEPMQAILATGARPDLVVADHGWAGAAAQAGLDVVGFADTNDPALFVAAAQGLLDIVVPLDDNVEPAAYDLLAAYLLEGVVTASSHGVTL